MPARDSCGFAVCLALLALAAGGCAKSRRDDAQGSRDASASDAAVSTLDAGSSKSLDGAPERGRDAAADGSVAKPEPDAGAPASPIKPDAATPPAARWDSGSFMEHMPPDEDGGEPFKPSYCRGTENFY